MDDEEVEDVAIEMTQASTGIIGSGITNTMPHPQSPNHQTTSMSSTMTQTPIRSNGNAQGSSNDINNNSRHNRGMTITTANESPTLPTVMKEKTRTILHRFFYPHQHKEYLSTHSSSGIKPPHSEQRRHKRTSDSSNNNVDDNDDNDDNDHDGFKKRRQPYPSSDDPNQSENDFNHVDDHKKRNNNDNDNKGSNTQETKHTPNDERYIQPDMNDPDVKFVTNFWTTFDDVLILSIFTQLGIVFRLAIAIWFTWFDDVFSNDSALFVNLPLNCLSCFLMGLLCSGERLMETISTRFSPPRTQHAIVQDQHPPTYDDYDVDSDDDMYSHSNSIDNRGNDGIVRHRTASMEFQHGELRRRQNNKGPFNNILRRRRRTKKEKHMNHERFVSWQPPVCLDEELRDVQLLALERRIRMSKCLVLFPVRKQDVDVMEHYFQHGYKRDNEGRDDVHNDAEDGSGIHFDEEIDENNNVLPRRLDNSLSDVELQDGKPKAGSTGKIEGSGLPVQAQHAPSDDSLVGTVPNGTDEATEPSTPNSTTPDSNADYITEITDLATNIQDNVQENLYRLRRVNLADGWDSGTTASAMSDDLMLGLRDGFCGALSSFSSWNSAMVALLRKGQVTQALVGYMIGLQLPIVAYRFGQHVAVYIFIWRTRRETRKDERRGGYGIRIANDEDDIEQIDHQGGDSDEDDDEEKKQKAAENEMPSLRAVITAIFIMAIVTQCTSIFFYNTPENQQIALSLLFSPLGVFARWRLTKLNRWKPTFPLGTFTCNILACALSGSLGDQNQVVLVSIVNGFGGTLSSLASFVVEILAGIDPVLFRYDGVIYAVASICCAMVVGFIFSASVEWADAVVTRTASVADVIKDDDGTLGNMTGNLTRYW
jgi:fluoride ion exporter CrcB/FEX